MATNFSIGCIFINNKFTRRLATASRWCISFCGRHCKNLSDI